MKLYIKNKAITIGGSSEVVNENKEPVYEVKGKWFTFTRKKKMYDMEGKLLYTIRNKYWSFGSHKALVFNAEGERVATIKKGRFSLNLNYEILDTENEMSIEGKFFTGKSTIMKNGKPVATISREFSLFKEAFALETEEEDIAFYTALVVAFDNLNDERDKDEKKSFFERD